MPTGGIVKLKDGTNAFTVGVKAPDTALLSDLLWTLPAVDGDVGDVLTLGNDGELSWSPPESGVTAPVTITGGSQTALTVTGNSLDVDAVVSIRNTAVPGFANNPVLSLISHDDYRINFVIPGGMASSYFLHLPSTIGTLGQALSITSVTGPDIHTGWSDVSVNTTDLLVKGLKLSDTDEAKFVYEVYREETLPENTTDFADAFNLNTDDYEGQIIEYRMTCSVGVRVGTLLVATDGTNATKTDTCTETGEVNVDWVAVIDSGFVKLQYTTGLGGGDRKMQATVKRFQKAV